MNKKLSAFFHLFLFSCSTPEKSLFNCSNRDFCAVEIVGIYDGDTFKVNLPGNHPLFGKELSIRLLGVDTAEIRTKDVCEKKYSVKAKELLSNLLRNARTVDLGECVRDKYFRLTCNVYADGVSANQTILMSGFAAVYDGGTKLKQDWCNLERSQK